MALVYMARNLVNGKRYIGVTRTGLARRVYMHVWNATTTAKGAKGWGIFGRAIRKYGKDAFEFSIMEDGLTFKMALERERALIAQLRPEYNISAGGYGPTGIKWTPERHQHMAKVLSASWTDERRAKHRAAFAGRSPSAATRAKMRAARIASAKATRRGVVCLNDGRWFAKIKDAGDAYGVQASRVSSSASGREVSAKGWCFAYADAPMTAEACAEELGRRQSRLAKRSEKSQLARSRPVVCITDGRAFPSGAAACKAYGLSQMTVVQCCQDGAKTVSGLRFRYADSDAVDKHTKTPQELAQIRARQNAGLVKAHSQNRKRVLCLEDSKLYPSISDAALAYGSTTALVSAAIRRGGTSMDRHFRFVED